MRSTNNPPTVLKRMQFWVKEVGRTGTMARQNTQNGLKCCNIHSPIKKTVHKGYSTGGGGVYSSVLDANYPPN